MPETVAYDSNGTFARYTIIRRFYRSAQPRCELQLRIEVAGDQLHLGQFRCSICIDRDIGKLMEGKDIFHRMILLSQQLVRRVREGSKVQLVVLPVAVIGPDLSNGHMVVAGQAKDTQLLRMR